MGRKPLPELCHIKIKNTAMFFQHIYDKSLAHGSYLLGCQATGEAIVIDAKRDIDTYLQIAHDNNLKITHITETHIHADFLCGSRELAAVTGAKLYLSDEGGPDWQYEFAHIGLHDGDMIKVGNLTLEVLHTPGHTPESITFILTDHPATDQPVMLFTGASRFARKGSRHRGHKGDRCPPDVSLTSETRRLAPLYSDLASPWRRLSLRKGTGRGTKQHTRI